MTAVGVNVFDVTTGHPFWLEATWRTNGTPVYRTTSGFCDPSPVPHDVAVVLGARYDLNDYPHRDDDDLMNSFHRLKVSVEEYRSTKNQQLTGSYA